MLCATVALAHMAKWHYLANKELHQRGSDRPEEEDSYAASCTHQTSDSSGMVLWSQEAKHPRPSGSCSSCCRALSVIHIAKVAEDLVEQPIGLWIIDELHEIRWRQSPKLVTRTPKKTNANPNAPFKFRYACYAS